MNGERLYQLFHAALEIQPAERSAFLKRECGEDEQLIQKLQRMLQYAEHSDALLNKSPWRRERVFREGEVISGRYRIERFLSMGGMGEVYVAQDTELGVPIALKTIRPEFAFDDQMLARFKREVLLEREVIHENVCPLYDFSRHETADGCTVHYLTMRFLAGETLADHLKAAGKLEPAEAVRIAGQIAAGLDAIHRAGILHRDLKSSNIMLMPSTDGVRAVVMDFGLAGRIEPDGLTIPGQAMGTLAYMAPELLAGETASTASDVYAFGIVFREMIAGRRDTATEIDGRWQKLIERCLDPDRNRRATLAEVIAALKQSTVLAPVRRRGAIIAAAGLLVVLSLFGAIWRLFKTSGSVKGDSLVYLIDMNNATQDPQLDSAGELLRNQLRQSSDVKLADDAKVARAKELIGKRGGDAGVTAREIAARVGASLVVFSTLFRVGDSYHLAVRMEGVGADPAVASRQVTQEWQAGGKQQIFAVLKDAGDFIRKTAGEAPERVASQDISPEEAATSSWEALDLYRKAETLRRQKQGNEAIAMLERAIEIDPDFAMAHIHLADILNGVRQQEEAFEHYQKALSAAAKRRLTRWEELLLRGNYALDTGDARIAEASFAELRRLYPQLYGPPHYMAAAVREQGRIEEAIRLDREAASRDPELTQPLVGIVTLSIRLGKLAEAELELQKLRSLNSDLASEYEGEIRFLRGDVAGARANFESASRSSDARHRSRGISLLAQALAEAGEYRRAETILQDGISADLGAGMTMDAALKHVAIASLQLRGNNFPDARNHALEAVRLMRAVELYRRAGTILARAGYPSDAQGLVNDIGPRWPGPLAEAARHQIKGEILLRRNETAAGIRELEAADRMDSPIHLREYLAHGYAQSGDKERALFIYESMIGAPGVFWQYADYELPGIRTSMLLETGRLASELGHAARAQAALREYRQIRGSADPNLPETLRAQQLVAGAP